MSDGIDIVKEAQKRHRGRTKSLIVLTKNFASQKAWAKELASQLGAQHVDLLDHFASDAELAGRVSSVTIDGLFGLVKGIAEGDMLVVSGMEFLRGVWSAQAGAMTAFADRVEKWTQNPALVFVTQFDKAIENRVSTRYGRHQFVFNQADTFALE